MILSIYLSIYLSIHPSIFIVLFSIISTPTIAADCGIRFKSEVEAKRFIQVFESSRNAIKELKDKRERILKEIIATEKSYCDSLEVIVKVC